MIRRTYALILVTLLAAGCASKTASNEVVRKAIMDYLAGRPGLDVSKMDVNLTKVTINGDRAEVDVSFTARGAPSNQGMAMHYTLTKSGDTWKVQAPAGGHAGADQPPNPHGGAPPMAGGDGGSGKAGSGGAFHPNTSGAPPTTKQ